MWISHVNWESGREDEDDDEDDDDEDVDDDVDDGDVVDDDDDLVWAPPAREIGNFGLYKFALSLICDLPIFPPMFLEC